MADQKIYTPLLDYLADRESAYVHELPKGLQDVKQLQVAWSDGVLEFGRRVYVETGEPSHDSKFHQKRVIVEPTINWTRERRQFHKLLREILAEDEDLPAPCFVVERAKDPKAEVLVTYKPVANTILRLMVRLTDKGLAALAA